MRNAALLLSLSAIGTGCIIYDDPAGVVVDRGPVVYNDPAFFQTVSATAYLAAYAEDDWIEFTAVVSDADDDVVQVWVDVWDAYDDFATGPVDSFDLTWNGGSSWNAGSSWGTSWDTWYTNLYPEYYADYYLVFNVVDSFGEGEELVLDYFDLVYLY